MAVGKDLAHWGTQGHDQDGRPKGRSLGCDAALFSRLVEEIACRDMCANALGQAAAGSPGCQGSGSRFGFHDREHKVAGKTRVDQETVQEIAPCYTAEPASTTQPRIKRHGKTVRTNDIGFGAGLGKVLILQKANMLGIRRDNNFGTACRRGSKYALEYPPIVQRRKS
jgi:hypothetical protein